MQINSLKPEFDKLQKKFGEKTLNSIYGAGCLNNPDICFVFMNPTGRNVSTNKKWKGIKAPWIGTKTVWKLFYQLDLLDKDIYKDIEEMKPLDWNEGFSEKVYKNISEKSIYITNLSKSTQIDAKHLPDSVFREYLPIFLKEMEIIKPKIIITFGNQVSSVLLDQPIKVSDYRKKFLPLKIKNNIYPIYPVYYPVGQGMRNIDKAIKDLKWIKKKYE